MRPLDTLTARLDHAWTYREAFGAEAHAFLQTRPNRVWDEQNPDTGEYSLYVEPTSRIPDRLGFLAADCIHNIRATLDNLICLMPGANLERATFVVLKNDPAPHEFAVKARPLKGIHADVIDAVEAVQRYKGVKANSTYLPATIGEMLQILNAMWNWDKHRAPTLAMQAVGESHVVVNGSTKIPIQPEKLQTFAEPLELFRIVPILGNRKMQIKAEIGFDVAFGAGPARGLHAYVLLTDLYNCVRHDVLPRFERWL